MKIDELAFESNPLGMYTSTMIVPERAENQGVVLEV